MDTNQQSLLGNSPQTPSREFFTISEVQQMLGIARSTLWRMKSLNRYQIEGSKRIYLKLSEIENAMQVVTPSKKVNQLQKEAKNLDTICNDKMKSLLAYIKEKKSEVKPEGDTANERRYSTLQEIESWIMIYGGIE